MRGTSDNAETPEMQGFFVGLVGHIGHRNKRDYMYSSYSRNDSEEDE
jgi:hypothetical protein